jgi:hypothetical protein
MCLKKTELLRELNSLSSSVIPDLLRSDPDGRQDRDFHLIVKFTVCHLLTLKKTPQLR